MLLELGWNPILCSPDTAGLGLMETPRNGREGNERRTATFTETLVTPFKLKDLLINCVILHAYFKYPSLSQEKVPKHSKTPMP